MGVELSHPSSSCASPSVALVPRVLCCVVASLLLFLFLFLLLPRSFSLLLSSPSRNPKPFLSLCFPSLAAFYHRPSSSLLFSLSSLCFSLSLSLSFCSSCALPSSLASLGLLLFLLLPLVLFILSSALSWQRLW